MIKSGGVVGDTFLYLFRSTYLGTRGHKEGVRRLAAVHELDPVRRYIYGGKNQISNLAFIYACAEIVFLSS